MYCTCHISTFLATVHRQSGCGAAEQPSGDRGCDEENTGEWKLDKTPFKNLQFFMFPCVSEGVNLEEYGLRCFRIECSVLSYSVYV